MDHKYSVLCEMANFAVFKINFIYIFEFKRNDLYIFIFNKLNKLDSDYTGFFIDAIGLS